MAKKLTGELETDFEVLVLGATAESIIHETAAFFKESELLEVHRNKKAIIDFLVKHAKDTYRAQFERKDGRLFKIKDETVMRDQLMIFMRHWLCAWVNENLHHLFEHIPTAFINGEKGYFCRRRYT